MLRKWSYNFHSNCHNTFWTLKNCPMRFDTIDNTRKSRPQNFFRWNESIFSKNCVFNNFWVLKNAHICSTVIVKLACGPFWIVSRGFLHSIKRGKTGQKLLSSWKSCFWNVCFYRLPRFYRNDLITHTAMARKPCGPHKMFPEAYHTR